MTEIPIMSHDMIRQASSNPPPHPPMAATAEQGASFLMALKHLSASPGFVEDASQCVFERSLIDTADKGIRLASDGTSTNEPSLLVGDQVVGDQGSPESPETTAHVAQEPARTSRDKQVTPDLSPQDDLPFEFPDLSLPAPPSGSGSSGGAAVAAAIAIEDRHMVLFKQRRLVLLHHASKCSHPDGWCPVTPHCAQIKRHWKHIAQCKDQTCRVQHCLTSRFVLSHYKRCKDMQCLVCGPVREAIHRGHESSEMQKLMQPMEQRQDQSSSNAAAEGGGLLQGAAQSSSSSSSSTDAYSHPPVSSHPGQAASSAAPINASPPPADTSEDFVLVARKRHRELEEESGRTKVLKGAVEDVAEEFLCPITTELPVDPVTAEDGRVYERSAIEMHIQSQGANLRSPMTSEPMGARLFPAVQVSNTIKALVTKGAILGSKADAWKEKIADAELVARTRKKANGGDVRSMFTLSHWYSLGEKGLEKDDAQAYQWCKKGSDLRDTRCMALAGSDLINGVGVEKNETFGISLISMAAMNGCEQSASLLGNLHRLGRCGLPKDSENAKYWLRKVAGGNCSILNYGHNKRRERATQMLQELGAELV